MWQLMILIWWIHIFQEIKLLVILNIYYLIMISKFNMNFTYVQMAFTRGYCFSGWWVWRYFICCKYLARTKPQYNAKFCTLDRDELPVWYVQTRRLNPVKNDDHSFCGDENKVVGTTVLNKEFYEMLVISCNKYW